MRIEPTEAVEIQRVVVAVSSKWIFELYRRVLEPDHRVPDEHNSNEHEPAQVLHEDDRQQQQVDEQEGTHMDNVSKGHGG